MAKVNCFKICTMSLLLALGLAACGKSSEDGKKGTDQKPAADKPAASGPKFIKIDKLGLQVEAPEGTQVSDGIGGAGVMLQGDGLVMTIESAEGKPEDADKAKEDVEMYTPQDFKVEKLEDGFLLTFTNKGGMGTNYWLVGRRTIDGKHYWCSTTAAKAEFQTSAAKACKSLKK